MEPPLTTTILSTNNFQATCTAATHSLNRGRSAASEPAFSHAWSASIDNVSTSHHSTLMHDSTTIDHHTTNQSPLIINEPSMNQQLTTLNHQLSTVVNRQFCYHHLEPSPCSHTLHSSCVSRLQTGRAPATWAGLLKGSPWDLAVAAAHDLQQWRGLWSWLVMAAVNQYMINGCP